MIFENKVKGGESVSVKSPVDIKDRKISGVMVYTGTIPKNMTKDQFKKKLNLSYPSNGYYLSLGTFYSDKKISKNIFGFPVRSAKLTNAVYKGLQFLYNSNTGDIYWLYYIPLACVNKFKYLKLPYLDYNIIENAIIKNGFSMRWSEKYIDALGSNRHVVLFYNTNKNMLLKIDTDFALSNKMRLFGPTNALPLNYIFERKSMTGTWDQKMFQFIISPYFNKCGTEIMKKFIGCSLYNELCVDK